MEKEKFTGNEKVTTDILGQTWKYNCMGCSIVNKEIISPGGIIYEGKYTIIAADPEVPIPEFMILNFKRHIRSFSELTKEERDEVGDIISMVENGLKDLDVCNNFTLVQEERSKHFHIWIFPHYDWMEEKFGKGISYLRDIMQYARENSDDLTIKEVLDVVSSLKDYLKK